MLIESIIAIISGYLIGRIGDYFAGHWDTIHHWIYGAILFIIGIIYRINPLLFYAGLFGVGLIISDFEDLWNMNIYGPDRKNHKRFWGFD